MTDRAEDTVEVCRGERVFDLPRPEVEYRYRVTCPNCDRPWSPSISAGISRYAGTPNCPDCGADFRAWIEFQRLFAGVR